MRMLELAQRRIAFSIMMLERLMTEPPPPPPNTPTSPIKSMFRKRAKPQSKLKKDFNEY